MKTKCKVCTVMCDISRGNELKDCAFEHNGDENICPFDARYLDLSEYKKQIRADAIEEAIHKINEHRNVLSADYNADIITEEDYKYRDSECLWVIEIFEQLKEQK